MKKIFCYGRVLVLLIAVFCIFNSCQTVLAASSKGLTLSPLRNELEIQPGTAQSGSLVVTNNLDKKISVHFNAEAFSVINQQYDYAFNVEAEVSSWVIFSDSDVDLDVNETKTVEYSINIPNSAEPGGRYLSLFASTDSDDGTTKQRIASLLYITVAGDVSRAGSLVSISTPWWVTSNGTWDALIKNTDTTHYHSIYSVKLYSLIGGDSISEDSNNSLILPNTIRSISGQITSPKIPGIYKAVFLVGLGDSPAVERTVYILFAPIWLVSLSLLMIFLLVFFATLKLKQKKKKTLNI